MRVSLSFVQYKFVIFYQVRIPSDNNVEFINVQQATSFRSCPWLDVQSQSYVSRNPSELEDYLSLNYLNCLNYLLTF